MKTARSDSPFSLTNPILLRSVETNTFQPRIAGPDLCSVCNVLDALWTEVVHFSKQCGCEQETFEKRTGFETEAIPGRLHGNPSIGCPCLARVWSGMTLQRFSQRIQI